MLQQHAQQTVLVVLVIKQLAIVLIVQLDSGALIALKVCIFCNTMTEEKYVTVVIGFLSVCL